MRYEQVNRICKCTNVSVYIFKGPILDRDIRDRMDTCCSDCLQDRIRAQCTGMSEWEPLTDKVYDKRNEK